MLKAKISQPNAAQKRWREAVRGLGSVVSGGPAVIHHPVGRTGRHNKVDIGHWWVIPLTDEEHKALHNGETFGFGSRKEFEKDAYGMCSVKLALLNQLIIQPPMGAHNAIMDYHR